MKDHEVSPKTLSAWMITAMLGPAALAAAKSPWSAVLTAAIVCGCLCAVTFRFGGDFSCRSRAVNIPFMLWNVYAAAEIAAQAGQCWPGKGSQVVTALVLIALGAVSACGSERKAGAVAATVFPLCGLIFAIVLACGIVNIRWERVEVSAAPPDGMQIFVFLLPIAAMAVRRKQAPSAGVPAMIGLLAVIISIVVMGAVSLPVMLTRNNSFYEFSKSLDIFGTVRRFESVVAVAVTMSLFAAVSLLLSGVGSVAETICRGSAQWAVLLGALSSAGIVIFKLWLSEKAVAILSILIWGFIGPAGKFFPVKKVEKT